jgi:hypothetical protein
VTRRWDLVCLPFGQLVGFKPVSRFALPDGSTVALYRRD